jgi:hypothetical protein
VKSERVTLTNGEGARSGGTNGKWLSSFGACEGSPLCPNQGAITIDAITKHATRIPDMPETANFLREILIPSFLFYNRNRITVYIR